MDNCGGPNKNRMVLCMLFVLVKLKLCFKARMIFLVKWHTKKDCDCMFNLMKKTYQKTNCYTSKQMFDFVINSHKVVKLVDVMNDGGFMDWDRAQNSYMRTLESIQKITYLLSTQPILTVYSVRKLMNILFVSMTMSSKSSIVARIGHKL